MFSVGPFLAHWCNTARNKGASENNTDRSWDTIRFIFSSKMVRWPLSIKQLTSDFTNVTNSGIHNAARSSHCRSCIDMIPLVIYSRDIGCRLFTSIQVSVQARRVSDTIHFRVLGYKCRKCYPAKSKTGLTPVLLVFWLGTVKYCCESHVQPNTTSKQRTR